MTNAAIQRDSAEAARLFERGVAAARGGQRRLAAGLLARAVQCDPRHEQAWLWLSGVLESPDEIAFCLRSVLTINPANERAQRGLNWLAQQQTAAANAPATPATPAVLAADASAPAPATTPAWRRLVPQPEQAPADATPDSWWVVWRRSRRDIGRARLLVWLVPLLLLGLTLGLNLALRDTVDRNAETARAILVPLPTAVPPDGPLPTPTPAPILRTTITSAEQAQALAYFSALTPQRTQLNDAITVYREATSRPGNASGVHAAAARRLRTAVETGRTAVAALSPPPALQEAHASYVDGLGEELAALDDILEFYGSFNVELANRATQRMDTASRRMELARVGFNQYLARTGLSRPWESFTVR